MLGTYIYHFLLYYGNKRYTNLYHKINAIISNKIQEEIIIDFLIKEAIYVMIPRRGGVTEKRW